jgi:lysophospholipase L1-like esterase
MTTDDTRGHAAPQITETLTGADRSTAAGRGRASAVIIVALLAPLGVAEARCGTPPLAARRIEDPGGAALAHFYNSLRRTEAARAQDPPSPAVTRVAHYGDSHVAADILTGALRRAFARDFGDAGPGFLPAGRPYAWSHRDGVRIEASGGWRADGLGTNVVGGAFGLAGITFSTSRAGERIRIVAAADRFTVYLLRQPAGGEVAVYLDGEVHLPRVSLDLVRTGEELGAAPDSQIFVDGRALYAAVVAEPFVDGAATHTLELRTLGAGPVRVLGVEAERGAAGVAYDVFGINGARATRPLAWDWGVMASNLNYRAPDLIVVAYGSNEVGDVGLNLGEYERQFAELLRRFRASAPEASLLVVAPPDRAAFSRRLKRWQTLKALPALVAAQRRAALSEGAAFWDLYRAMGGAGSIAQWAARPQPLAQADRVHLTAAGYRLLAAALYAELMRGYAANSETADAPKSEPSN